MIHTEHIDKKYWIFITKSQMCEFCAHLNQSRERYPSGWLFCFSCGHAACGVCVAFFYKDEYPLGVSQINSLTESQRLEKYMCTICRIRAFDASINFQVSSFSFIILFLHFHFHFSFMILFFVFIFIFYF